MTYARDAAGRVSQKSEAVDGEPTLTEDYTYDLAGRLKTVTRSGQKTTYSYDANGNRTKREVRDAFDSLVSSEVGAPADAQDRLPAYGDFTYSYDARGNLTSKARAGETTRYEYNALGWLTKVSLPDGRLIEYLYDGLGRRTAKKVGAAVTHYIWNSNLTLAAEVDPSGVVTRYAYGAKRVPELVRKNNVTYKVVADQLGSIRMLIDVATGDVKFERRYDEYGRILAETGDADDVTSVGFAGGLYDADTDLVRFGARDYDSYTGRWTAKDPIGLSGGLNVYEYCGGDPENTVDPRGTFPFPFKVFDVFSSPWSDPAAGLGLIFTALNVLTPRFGSPSSPTATTHVDLNKGNPVIVLENSWLACGNDGLTIGHVVALDGTRASDPETYAHELAHVGQHDTLGKLFLPLHGLAQAYSLLKTGTYSGANWLEKGPNKTPPRPW